MKIKKIISYTLCIVLAAALCLNVTACGKSKFTVTFDTMGGSAVAAAKYKEGKDIERPADPTRDYYTFAGWTRDAEGNVGFDFGPMPGSDITVYAKWNPIASYKVRFDTMGGSAVADVTFPEGGIAEAPETPTKEGYAFAGWYTSADYTSAVTFPAQLGASDVTLYAKWNVAGGKAEVKYYLNGALYDTSVVTAGGVAAAPDLGSDYTVSAWYTDPALTKSFDFTAAVNADISLYALYYNKGMNFQSGKVTSYHGTASTVVVPSAIDGVPVTGIESYAFAGNENVKKVILPASVVSVGTGAFSGCAYLSEINLDAVETVDAYAFYNCARLRSADTAKAAQLGNYAFAGAVKLNRVRLDAAAAIGAYAFAGCGLLKNVTLHEGLETVGAYAFADTAIESLRLPASLTEIHGSSLKSPLTELTLAEGNESFALASGLLVTQNGSRIVKYLGTETAFAVPAAIESIDELAFFGNATVKTFTADDIALKNVLTGMEALTRLIVPRLTSGGYLAEMFGAETALSGGAHNDAVPETLATLTLREEITAGNTTEVPAYAFYGLSSLRTVEFPVAVTEIGEGAFHWSGVESLYIPDGMTAEEIDAAVTGCARLTSFEVSAENAAFKTYKGNLYDTTLTKLIKAAPGQNNPEFAETMTEITARTVGVDAGGNTVYAGAFTGSYADTVVVPDLAGLKIAKGAFYKPAALAKISVPFLGPDKAETAKRESETIDTAAKEAAVHDYFGYIFGADKTVRVLSSGVTVDINTTEIMPETLELVTLTGEWTAVPNYGFYGVPTTAFKLPDTVTEIGDSAFLVCLKLITFDLSRIDKIGEMAFQSSFDLQELTISGDAVVGEMAFADLPALKKLEITEASGELDPAAAAADPRIGVNISRLMFYGYYRDSQGAISALDVVKLPSTLYSIGEAGFAMAGLSGKHLDSVSFQFPKGCNLVKIEKQAFAQSGIEYLSIPYTVTSIGAGAFAGCTILKRVTIGDPYKGSRLATIGETAFFNIGDCDVFEMYKFKSDTVPTLQGSLVISGNVPVTVKVPEESVKIYRAAAGWSGYAIEGLK